MSEPIRLRYAATCHHCEAPLPPGSRAAWDRDTKVATCVACVGASSSAAPGDGETSVPVDAPTPAISLTTHLRFGAVCTACGAPMAPGTEARWDAATRRATHPVCPRDQPTPSPVVEPVADESPLDVGVAGGSARKIADRQVARRASAKQQQDEATREAHPRIGNVLVKARDLLAEPEKPTSWQKGAEGEEALGRRLDRLCAEGFRVLHDRRKPGTKWNIDHLVVGPRGVYVIDAKHYSGRLELRPTGTLFRPGPKRVYVKGRPQDRRVEGMNWQMESVREAAGDLIEEFGGVIRPVLCFIGVELRLTQQPDLVGPNNVLVTWPRRLVKDVGRDGPLSPEQRHLVAARIADALPAAVAASARR